MKVFIMTYNESFQYKFQKYLKSLLEYVSDKEMIHTLIQTIHFFRCVIQVLFVLYSPRGKK